MTSKVLSRKPRLSPRTIAVGHCRAGSTPGGLEKKYIDDYIGYGLFASVAWSKGDFLIQYRGILLSEEEALRKNDATYQYYFLFKGKNMCIDATDDSCLAKYANDDKKGNAQVKLLEVDDLPCLCIFACRDISPGEEIRYNYGVNSLPWRYTEHQESPHQLVEQWVDLKQCYVCHSILNGQKWKGLLCVVCQSVWHEECFLATKKSSRSCSGNHPTGEDADDVIMSGTTLDVASSQNMENMKSFQPVVLLKRTSPADQAFKDSLASAETSVKAGTITSEEDFAPTLSPFSVAEAADIDIAEIVNRLDNQLLSSHGKKLADEELTLTPVTESEDSCEQIDNDSDEPVGDECDLAVPPSSTSDSTSSARIEITTDSEDICEQIDNDSDEPVGDECDLAVPPSSTSDFTSSARIEINTESVCEQGDNDGDEPVGDECDLVMLPSLTSDSSSLARIEATTDSEDICEQIDNDSDEPVGDECDLAVPPPSTSGDFTSSARIEINTESEDICEQIDSDGDEPVGDECDLAVPPPSTSDSTSSARIEINTESEDICEQIDNDGDEPVGDECDLAVPPPSTSDFTSSARIEINTDSEDICEQIDNDGDEPVGNECDLAVPSSSTSDSTSSARIGIATESEDICEQIDNDSDEPVGDECDLAVAPPSTSDSTSSARIEINTESEDICEQIDNDSDEPVGNECDLAVPPSSTSDSISSARIEIATESEDICEQIDNDGDEPVGDECDLAVPPSSTSDSTSSARIEINTESEDVCEQGDKDDDEPVGDECDFAVPPSSTSDSTSSARIETTTESEDDDDWPPPPPPLEMDVNIESEDDDDWPPPPPPLEMDVNIESEDDDDWPPPPPPLEMDVNIESEKICEQIDNDGDEPVGDECDLAVAPPSTSDFTSSARTETTTESEDICDQGDNDDDEPVGDEYDFIMSSPSTSDSTSSARNETTTGKRSTSYPAVTLPVYSKNNGSRNYDKLQCCFVCDKLVKTKMARHLYTHAETEAAVADAVNDKNKKSRAAKLEALRLLGNFNHNVKVLKEGCGELIVVRRSHHTKVAEDYLPCLKCYGFIDIAELWRHVSHCKLVSRPVEIGEAAEMDMDEGRDTTLTAKCRMLLSGAIHGKNSLFVSDSFQDLRREVIQTMREDEVKKVVEGDELILMYGSSLLERLGSLRKHVISQRMRQLSRLVIEFKKEFSETSLMNIIDPSLFDDVVYCVRGICGDSSESTIAGVKMFDCPSYGLHIGHALVKCCMLKRGRAIRLKDNGMKEEAVFFQELMEGQDWIAKVSSPALQSLKERRLNSVDELPSTSDLRKLNSYTAQKLREAQQKLEDTPTEYTWRELSHTTFVLVTTFNKRRSGEVGKMSLDSYTQRPDWRKLRNEEMENALSSMELKLADRFDMVQLPGKRGRKVPLLLKPEWVAAMDSLVELREACDVKSKFFFGVPGKSGPINSWKVIRDMAVEAGCEKPELISTTRMRKYTATVLQLLSLHEGELEWVSNHLGHNIDIHRLSYRLHESTIECSKVAKLLMAVESGTMSNYSGCSLDDLDVNDINITLENGEDSLSESEQNDEQSEAIPEVSQKRKHREEGINKTVRTKRRRPWVEESDDDDNTNDPIPEVSQKRKHREEGINKIVRTKRRRPSVEESDEDDSTNDQEKAPRISGKRRRWSAEEIKILKTYFSKEFSSNILPSFSKIKRLMVKYPAFKQRNPASIKSRFQYMLKQHC